MEEFESVDQMANKTLSGDVSDHGSQADCLLALAYIQHAKSGRQRPFEEQARIAAQHLERCNIPQQICE